MKFIYVLAGLISTVFIIGTSLFTMSNKSKSSQWFNEVVQHNTDKRSGQFLAQDKKGILITLDWEKIAIADQAFAPKMESLTDIFVSAHTRPNVELLKQHPEAASRVKELQYFEQFFKQGIESVDWQKIEELMKIGTKRHWAQMTQTLDAKGMCWFVTAHDQATDKKVAFVQFLLLPSYTYGSIKVKNLMIYPEAQHRGLGKLLISSIFNIIPSIKRIFLSTLATNAQAQQAYKSYGFKEFTPATPIERGTIDEYETYFEYLVDQSDILQKEANSIKEQFSEKE